MAQGPFIVLAILSLICWTIYLAYNDESQGDRIERKLDELLKKNEED